jgi:hypothetical protein
VAVLSLALSVTVVYNGSSRQDSYEANRQLCVDGLAQYGRTVAVIQMTGHVRLSPEHGADLIVGSARAEISCFSTDVIDSDSSFVKAWRVNVSSSQSSVALRQGTNEGVVGQSIYAVSDAFLAQQLDAVNVALEAAIKASGPGYFPWETARPAVPEKYPEIEITPQGE